MNEPSTDPLTLIDPYVLWAVVLFSLVMIIWGLIRWLQKGDGGGEDGH